MDLHTRQQRSGHPGAERRPGGHRDVHCHGIGWHSDRHPTNQDSSHGQQRRPRFGHACRHQLHRHQRVRQLHKFHRHPVGAGQRYGRQQDLLDHRTNRRHQPGGLHPQAGGQLRHALSQCTDGGVQICTQCREDECRHGIGDGRLHSGGHRCCGRYQQRHAECRDHRRQRCTYTGHASAQHLGVLRFVRDQQRIDCKQSVACRGSGHISDTDH